MISWTLIIFATINFAVRIPILDSKIESNQNSILWFYTANQKYESNEQTGLISFDSLRLFGKTVNKNEPEYIAMLNETYLIKRLSLVNMYLLAYNELPPLNLVDNWSKMDFSELEKEKEKYLPLIETRIQSLYEIREDLSKNKQSIVLWSVIIQILGLSLGQLAVILQFKWFR